MQKYLIIFLLFMNSFSLCQEGGTIEGVVKNRENNEILNGATILLEGTKFGTSTDQSGYFILENINPGYYTISASHIGFIVQKKLINVTEGKSTNVNFTLVPSLVTGQEVIITATRAKERETPVAFTNVSQVDIESKYWAQDMPMLLNELPNIYSYSDNGNGIGYSYMKIRGFDQNRIGVMINGIPLNDAESHGVFWVDLPDFAASTEDIQVQRGVGNSLYGASAFGGSLNLQTMSTTQLPKFELTAGYGSFNTRKFSIAANSGIIDNTYNFYGRFSSINTDGYRQPSWSNLWSYFFSLTRYDETMTTRINIFGGPEKSFLSYSGVTRDYLEGKITGNKKDDRRYNPIQYPNEIDNYFQPHFQLINDWQLNNEIKIENTIFTFFGKGDYTQKRDRRDVREYNISRFIISDSTMLPSDYYRILDKDATLDSFQVRYFDIVRKRSVEDIDYGWQPRITFNHENGELVFGAEYRYHEGHHFGEVIWASILPQNIEPDWRYYDYIVPKTSLTAYIHELYHPTTRISLMGDLQIRHHLIKLQNEKRYNTRFERKFTFITPRAGINYNLTDHLNVFLNFSIAKREPAFKDIYNPQDYWVSPINLPLNFSKQGDYFIYQGKEIKSEKLFDYEIGSAYRTEDVNFKFNLYWMDFNDEIIPTGQIDDNGVPISGNADKTVHRGIEITTGVKFFKHFRLDGNLSINDDKFIRHTEYIVSDWNTTPPTTEVINYDGKRLSGFPQYIFNLRFSFLYKNLSSSFHIQNVGRIFLDNTQNKEHSISPYTVVNGNISYKFEKLFGKTDLECNLIGNNLLNRLYETAGYVDADIPYWIPAATRNFFFQIRMTL